MDSSLPVLRLVRTSALIVHETVDPQRVRRLLRQFQGSAIFTNPPIVAALGRGKYVVLDGANRTAVCNRLHLRTVAVQVVPYRDPAIKVLTWNHVLDHTAAAWWRAVLRRLGNSLIPFTQRTGRTPKEPSAVIALRDGTTYRVAPAGSTAGDVTRLNTLVDTYRGKYTVHRTTDGDLQTVQDFYPHASALVIFPALQKRTVLAYARSGLRIPSGISRHVIPGRVLRLDVPFTLLRSKKPVAEQNRWLHTILQQRQEHNRIRLYSEPVYLYNE